MLDAGATLGDVTGVVNYNFGNFEVLARDLFEPTNAAPDGRDHDAHRLRRPAHGRELQPAQPRSQRLRRRRRRRQRPVRRAGAPDREQPRQPDIVNLEEVQDKDGSINSAVTDAASPADLVNAIAAAGGPHYAFIDNPPADDTSGGAPGGNIRVAMLYNPERVTLVDGSVRAITDPNLADGDAFATAGSRCRRAFAFHENEYTVIANHSTSRSGSTPLFGATQPPIDAGDDQRQAQAQVIHDTVGAILASDATANVIVAGDFNGFQFEEQFNVLQGGCDPCSPISAICAGRGTLQLHLRRQRAGSRPHPRERRAGAGRRSTSSTPTSTSPRATRRATTIRPLRSSPSTRTGTSTAATATTP
jgi:hypothetical protein